MFYKFARVLFVVLYKFLYFYKIEGRENIPERGFMVCANHTGLSDPIFIGLALDTKVKISFMAKVELFKNKPFAWVLRHLNAFPVNRGEADIKAVKEALKVLKSNERLALFPEGTRNSDYGARAGAGMFALHTGCDILPVYISPGRKPFHRVRVVVGKPYKAVAPEGTAAERYQAVADDILGRIYELGAKKN